MNVYPIEAGNFKLDGGAMFGVVPKSLWQKTNPSDSDNMIDMSARCLLVEDGKRLVLIDTGMGNKQSEKFFSYYKRSGNYSLVESIKNAGFGVEWTVDTASLFQLPLKIEIAYPLNDPEYQKPQFILLGVLTGS